MKPIMRTRYAAVYHDQGTGEFSRAALVAALAKRFHVRRIYASEIVASDAWHASTELLALPGGADLPYGRLLNGAGNASILRYIEAGGSFLGVCAGAYYVSRRIAFEAGSPAAITGQRELALFAGTARGSLHDLAEPYSLEHLRCAALASLRASATQQHLHALYWGGPEFIADADANVRPLLTYESPSRLAALRTDVGKGRVVLSGVHAEVSGAQFPIEVSRFGDASFEHGMRVSAELGRVEDERQQAFDLLLDALSA
jgi:biotin--protein ligase